MSRETCDSGASRSQLGMLASELTPRRRQLSPPLLACSRRHARRLREPAPHRLPQRRGRRRSARGDLPAGAAGRVRGAGHRPRRRVVAPAGPQRHPLRLAGRPGPRDRGRVAGADALAVPALLRGAGHRAGDPRPQRERRPAHRRVHRHLPATPRHRLDARRAGAAPRRDGRHHLLRARRCAAALERRRGRLRRGARRPGRPGDHRQPPGRGRAGAAGPEREPRGAGRGAHPVARGGAGRRDPGPPRGRAGEPGQDPLPRQHEPRAAHAAERDHRLHRAAARGHSRRPAASATRPRSSRRSPARRRIC
jgi:hypothetical protein